VPRRRPIEELDRTGNEARRSQPLARYPVHGDFRIGQMVLRIVAGSARPDVVVAPVDGQLGQIRSCALPGAKLRRTETALQGL